MIKKAIVSNIQSHKNTEMFFTPGINCIIGSSDNGKSAFLRALFWGIKNRPIGIDNLASHWARNEKGKLIDDISVEIHNDKGELKRLRNSTTNAYTLRKKESKEPRILEAVKTDVPDEVEAFFNLSETNIQHQQDAPFLLSASSADVARFFNRIVRLDIIDRVLGNAENMRRKNKQELEAVTKQYTSLLEQDEKLNWIEDINKYIEKLESVENRLSVYLKYKEDIEDGIHRIEELKDVRACAARVHKATDIIKNIEELSVQIAADKNKYNKMNADICDYKQSATITKKTKNCKKAMELVLKIDTMEKGIDPLHRAYTKLNQSIVEYSYETNEKKKAMQIVKDQKKELPKECPLCGNAIK